MTIRIDDIVKGGGGERGKDKSVVKVIPYTVVDPMIIDISDMTVDEFLARPYLWKPRIGGGFTHSARGIVNSGELANWIIANLKEIIAKATPDHPFANDPDHTEFLEALDRA